MVVIKMSAKPVNLLNHIHGPLKSPSPTKH